LADLRGLAAEGALNCLGSGGWLDGKYNG
jgi:hypothetical protein